MGGGGELRRRELDRKATLSSVRPRDVEDEIMPPITRQTHPATYTDLEAVPPHLVAEILYGTLVTHPRPVPRDSAAVLALAEVLVGPFQRGIGGPSGWIFLVEPELHLGEHAIVPDLAAWRTERLPASAVDKSYIEVALDWVLEALSPSTERYDRGDKRRIYAEFGVPCLWHLDPRVRSLETFIRSDRAWTVGSTYFETDDVCAAPFGVITFSLGLMWPFDMPPPAHA